jgi:hypothetical protein
MTQKGKKKSRHQVHKELEGFQVDINEYGEIVFSKSLDEINRFLDKHLSDKKFRGKKILRKIGEKIHEIRG